MTATRTTQSQQPLQRGYACTCQTMLPPWEANTSEYKAIMRGNTCGCGSLYLLLLLLLLLFLMDSENSAVSALQPAEIVKT